MAHGLIRFVDQLDRRPIPGAQVTLELRGVALDTEPTSLPGLKRLPMGPIDPLRDVNIVAEETVSRQATTDGDGRIEVDFGEVMARLAEQGDTTWGRLHIDQFRRLGVSFGGKRIEGPLLPDQDLEEEWPVDLGHAIVGHTTGTSTRLWVQLTHAPPDGTRTVLEVHDEDDQRVDHEVLDPDRVTLTDTHVVDGLAPGRAYRYTVGLEQETGDDQLTLLTGSFRTATDEPRLTFAFGSCHLPTVPEHVTDAAAAAHESLDRWRELASRDDHDLVLLIGDQIYGDNIEDKWPDADWLTRYRRRYRQLWGHVPMRDVLRRTPTYMVFDDHDVVDDFGTKITDGARVDAATDVYKTYQQPHNPIDGDDETYHYTFRRGPVSFFVMDGRTRRGDPDFPVFGAEQWRDIQAWANSEETRTADVIVFATPVPLSLLPSETLRRVFEEVSEQAGTTAGVLIGGAVGFALGSALGGPLAGTVVGAGALGALGYETGEELFEHQEQDLLLYGKDLAERWDLDANQDDLVRLMDLLFDLANGVVDDRPKAVLVLSGDIHTGTTHVVRSLRAGRGERHQRNPVILELTSSALSHTPVNGGLYAEAVARADEDLDLDLTDLNPLPLWRGRDDLQELPADAIDVDEVFSPGAGAYPLDSTRDRRLWTQFTGLLMQRTFGHVDVERIGPGRTYRLDLRIEGERDSLVHRYDIDLDSDEDELPRRTLADDQAEVSTVVAPSTARPRQDLDMTVTMRNTGVTTWTADRYELRSVGASVWGVDRVSLPRRTEPGEEATFQFQVTAPGIGTHGLRWRMARRADGGFGDVAGRDVQVERPVPDDGGDQGTNRCQELAEALAAAKSRRDHLQDELKGNTPGAPTGPTGPRGPVIPGGGVPTGGGAPPGPGPGIGVGAGKADVVKKIKEINTEIAGIRRRQQQLGCQ